jgi:MYXO-CTERM domain-containing protein
MRLLAGSLTLSLLAFAASPAAALEQKQHRVISRNACEDAGLPEEFCERVGVEAYDTDAYEWNDLAAHAQIADGQTACQGADAALAREQSLAADIHDSLDELSWSSDPDTAEHIAVQLGRALHTVQDNCAHHGQPNPQHAWASLSDACHGTLISPDVQSGALTCAAEQTTRVIDAFAAQVAAAGVTYDQLSDVEGGWTHWPARGDVCAFLATANSWDGTDGRWNMNVVEPALLDQLTFSLSFGDYSLGSACDGASLVPMQRAAVVNTSGGMSRCAKIKLYCVGKADDGTEEPPPWNDDGTTDEVRAAGCTVGGGGGAGAIVAPLVGLMLVMRRRRRA